MEFAEFPWVCFMWIVRNHESFLNNMTIIFIAYNFNFWQMAVKSFCSYWIDFMVHLRDSKQSEMQRFCMFAMIQNCLESLGFPCFWILRQFLSKFFWRNFFKFIKKCPVNWRMILQNKSDKRFTNSNFS